MMEGAPRAMRPVVHTVFSPADQRKLAVDSRQQAHGGETGAAAFGHGGAPGVVLLTGDGDAILPDRGDTGDDAGT